MLSTISINALKVMLFHLRKTVITLFCSACSSGAIDASTGCIKDGSKNRLRARDIHKIIDVFNNRVELPGYSRMVPTAEIAAAKNEYNLNITRYIDSQETEDIQDIEAHLSGGIPDRDIEALHSYWAVYPALKTDLLKPAVRSGYRELQISRDRHL